MTRFRSPLVTLAALWMACSGPRAEVPAIEGWTGEPQVATKIEEARRKVLDEPDSPEAFGRLGMVFQAHELHSEAIVCYRRAAELAPEEARWPYLAALSAAKDDLEAALGLFEEAAARGADHSAFFVNFGDVLARLAQPERAEEQYRKALEIDSKVTHALYGLAQLALSQGDLSEARELLERAVGIAPWHGEVRTLLGQTYQRLGLSEQAERELRAAGAYPDATQAADPVYEPVEAEAVTAVAFKSRARGLARTGQFAEAEKLYRKVLEIRPPTAGDYSNLGGALAGQGKIDEAIELYRQGLALDESDPYILNNLAMALAQKGDPRGAVENLSRAVEIEPQYPEAHHNLGLIRAGQRKYTEAIEHYQESLRQNPSYARAYNDLGTAQAALGRMEEAVKSWRLALEIDARELSALHNLSVALAGTGEHEEALEWLEKGFAIAPNSSRIATLLAWQLATAPKPELRNGARAASLARRVHQAYPNQPGAGDVFAATLAEVGQFEAAVEVAGRAAKNAVAAGQPALAAQIENRLDGYRRGRPYRQ